MGRRTVHLTLPTRDGGLVGVTSRTIAERLVGQAQAIEYLHESGKDLALDLAWEKERLRRLTRSLPVAVLIQLRLVGLEPEERPEGWTPAEAQPPVPSSSVGEGKQEVRPVGHGVAAPAPGQATS